MTEAPQPDGQWNRQGCMIVVALSVLIWAIIIIFGWWIFRYGVAVD